MKALLWTLVLSASMLFAEEQDEFPMLELSNSELKMALYLPGAEDGYYRGTRFDWSGIIARAEYKGIRFMDPGVFRTTPRGTILSLGRRRSSAWTNLRVLTRSKPVDRL